MMNSWVVSVCGHLVLCPSTRRTYMNPKIIPSQCVRMTSTSLQRRIFSWCPTCVKPKANENRMLHPVELCTGLSLVTRIMFGSGPDSGLVQMITIKCLKNISGFLGPFFFRKYKVLRSCTHLTLVTQSGSGNKSHRLDFLGDCRSCPILEIVRGNTLQTWYSLSLYRSSKAKITSDVLRASLNN
jgi:hypothetical protein